MDMRKVKGKRNVNAEKKGCGLPEVKNVKINKVERKRTKIVCNVSFTRLLRILAYFALNFPKGLKGIPGSNF